MSRYALELSYDGTQYHGWQMQDNAVTVQETLAIGLSTILRSEIAITGCGRTDTGVHASHFVAHFDHDQELVPNFIHRLNGVLPDDIGILNAFAVPNDFNARFDAKSRTYVYHILTHRHPFKRAYAYLYHRHLDMEAMNSACKVLMQYEEFGAFCKSNAQNKTNRCLITESSWSKTAYGLEFRITADRFLRNMVRAIVGTLIEIGENKIELDGLERIIESQNRQQAGYSVPAKGLFLHRIEYDRSNWKPIEK
ncbi:MAG: tRNA pseudouridine(38-40) synthase TruA [Bacteroidia bacterium]|nr:tRNA pseudouridine(38-40) synthase TruA [Bacteroidia bacterium]